MTAVTRRPAARQRWRADVGEPVVALDILPGGRDTPDALVAGGSEGQVGVFEADGTVRHALSLDDALLDVAASPDGTRVAAVGMASRRLWDTTSGDLLSGEKAQWSASAAWDDRSGRLAVADGKRVRILDRDGAVRWSSPPLASTVTNVLWPRGRLRVAASAYQGVTVLEPSGDRVTNRLRAPGAISGLAASPNGRWIVGGSQDATLHGWKVADGSDFRMSGFVAAVSRLAFEDSGRWMACASAEVLTCWDFSGKGPTGRAAVVLAGHHAPVTAFAWAPGERRTLVSGAEDGTVLVWRLTPTTKPADELRPVGEIPDGGESGDEGRTRDADPVTAITIGPGGRADHPTAYVARRSGCVDAMAIT